jgi:O-antigen biosynthesis protein
VSVPLVQAALSAARVSFTSPPPSRLTLLQRRTLTAFLHLLQPLARLCGRLRYGRTPWQQSAPHLSLPWPRMSTIWTERWQDPIERLACLEGVLRASGASVLRGGEYDRWDMAVCGGMLGATRLLMAVEDHGAGTQFVRFGSWPRCSPGAVVLTLLFSALALGAAIDQAWPAATMLGTGAVLLGLRMLQECAYATTAVLLALKQQK